MIDWCLVSTTKSTVSSSEALLPVVNPTIVDESGMINDDELGDDTTMDGFNGNNNAGLAIGIVLAVTSAAACTAAVLYRRKHRGRKSTYITFGNPSYSREHLPANDFSLDSPLTLSSNGYTVLA